MVIKKIMIISGFIPSISIVNSTELQVASLIQRKFDESKEYLKGQHQIIYYICDKFEKHINKISESGLPSYMKLKKSADGHYEHNKRAYKYIVTVKDLITSELCRAFGKINPYESFRYGEGKILTGIQTDSKMRYKPIANCTISELNYYVLCNYLDYAINKKNISKKTTDEILDEVVNGLNEKYKFDDSLLNRIKCAKYQIKEYVRIFKIDEFIKNNIANAQEINNAHNAKKYDDSITDNFLKKYDIRKLAGIHYGITNHSNTCNMATWITMLKSSKHVNKKLTLHREWLKGQIKLKMKEEIKQDLKKEHPTETEQELEKLALEKLNSKESDAEIKKRLQESPDVLNAMHDLFDAMDKGVVGEKKNDQYIGKCYITGCDPYWRFQNTLNGISNAGYDLNTGTSLGDWYEVTKGKYMPGGQYDIEMIEQIFFDNLMNKYASAIHKKVNEKRKAEVFATKKAIESMIDALGEAESLTQEQEEEYKTIRKNLEIIAKDTQTINYQSELAGKHANGITTILGGIHEYYTGCFEKGGKQLIHMKDNSYLDEYKLTEMLYYLTKLQKRNEPYVSITPTENNNSLQELLKARDKQYDGKYSYDKHVAQTRYCKQCNKDTDEVQIDLCIADNVLNIHRITPRDNMELTNNDDVMEFEEAALAKYSKTGVKNDVLNVKADKYIEFNGNLYVRRAGSLQAGSHFACIYTSEDGGEYIQSDDKVVQAKKNTWSNAYEYSVATDYCLDKTSTLSGYCEFINTQLITNADDLYSRCEDWIYDKVEW